MIRRLWELVTGRPWTTTRSATAEYGPPPGAVFADQLAAYTDAELVARPTADILADLRREVTGMGKRDNPPPQRKAVEDKVLAKARRLDPADKSTEAQQVRETAASIREHRSSPR